MVAAILAVVSAIVGLITGVANNDAASLAAKMQVNQDNTDYARNKEFTHYSAYNSLIKTIGFIIIGGLLLAGVIYYINSR